MIGIKCAACGKSFEVPDTESGKNTRCPDCGATVFVPVVGALEHETPASVAPTEKIEKPKHFLSPLEMVLILAILGIMIVFVVYRVVIDKPERTQPVAVSEGTRLLLEEAKKIKGVNDADLGRLRKVTVAIEQWDAVWSKSLVISLVDEIRKMETAEELRERIEELEKDKQVETACRDNMVKVADALNEYRQQHKVFPPDLGSLKETGILEGGVPLFCKKGRYAYYMREAVAAQGVVEDPILVADAGPVHRGGRNVIRMSGKVEHLDEKTFGDTVDAQQEEFAKLAASRDEGERKKKEREREAGKLMVEAATANQSGNPQEALEIYDRLLSEYADTELVKSEEGEIDLKKARILFTMEIENTRELVRQLRLDEAKAAYEKLGENASEEHKKMLEDELGGVSLIENGRALHSLGDLSGALEQYTKLGGATTDPFWKRIAHELSTEIENYRKEAAALFTAAENALKAGRKVRALSLAMSLRDNYTHSAEWPKVKPIIAELIGEVPYCERFGPKEKLLDKNTITAINNGLGWLALKQSDGGWKSSSTGKSALDELSLTGLVTLCFLAEGNTHLSGLYRGVVAGAVNKLKAAQKDSGLIGDPASPMHRLSHAFALLALCELRNMTDDESLTPVCQKALDYAIKIQETGTGWRLADKRAPSDIMLTTWMQLGMLSASAGKLKFLEGLLDGALNTYNAASDAEGRVNYSKPSDLTRPQRHLPSYQAALTATASAAYGKLASGSDPRAAKLRGAIKFLRDNLPNRTRTNFPFFFFGTYTLFQADELTYKEWKWALKRVLLQSQLTEGKDAGAWDMGQFSDFRGAKIYPSALAVLSLQAPYNFFAGVNLRAKTRKEVPKGPEVTLVFKDGVRISGRLLSETDEKVTIEIVKGTTRGEMTFNRKDIREIKRK